MEINFIANDIVYEVTEDNSYLVGFADDKNEPKEYVIVERALEFDEQDIKWVWIHTTLNIQINLILVMVYVVKSSYVKMRLSFQ